MSGFLALVALWESSTFKVYVGDKPVAFSKALPLRRGKLFLIPLRETVEAMGGTYVAGPIGRHVYLRLGRRRVDLALNGGRSRVDGAPRRLKAAPWISKGEVVVPSHFFSEALHATVVSNSREGWIRIYSGGGIPGGIGGTGR